MVLSSSRDSTVRRRRRLYEAVLQLERGGATVLERELRSPDAALSASTCLLLCTEASLQASSCCHCLQSKPLLRRLPECATLETQILSIENSCALDKAYVCAFAVQGPAPMPLLMERMRALLLRLSCAYSRCITVFEGSEAFEAQVQDSMHQLHALAVRAGIGLQCLTSTNEAATQVKACRLAALSLAAPVVNLSTACKAVRQLAQTLQPRRWGQAPNSCAIEGCCYSRTLIPGSTCT